jgi:hypothetical protein
MRTRGLTARLRIHVFGGFVFLLLCLPQIAATQDSSSAVADPSVPIPTTPFEIWGKIDQLAKGMYLQGLLGGLSSALLLNPGGAKTDETRALLRCALPGSGGRSSGPRNLSVEQSIAIIDKHLKENPEKWNQPLFVVVYNILEKSCKSI